MRNREEAVTASDRALDREIELALAVQPSPEFVARLRAAVPAGSPASRQLPWIWIAASAAGDAIAVVLLMGSVVAPERGEVPQPPQLAVSPHLASIPPNRLVPEIRALEAPHRASPVSSVRLKPRRIEPELLLAAAESAALKRLMRGPRQGRVDPSAFDSFELQQAGPPRAIVVPAIAEISPLPSSHLDSKEEHGSEILHLDSDVDGRCFGGHRSRAERRRGPASPRDREGRRLVPLKVVMSSPDIRGRRR